MSSDFSLDVKALPFTLPSLSDFILVIRIYPRTRDAFSSSDRLSLPIYNLAYAVERIQVDRVLFILVQGFVCGRTVIN